MISKREKQSLWFSEYSLETIRALHFLGIIALIVAVAAGCMLIAEKGDEKPAMWAFGVSCK